MSSYTYSHKKSGKGDDYDNRTYAPGTYDSHVWELEKTIIARELRAIKPANVLDFACGTGRVTEFIEGLGIEIIYGLDVSEEMLGAARKKLEKTILIHGSLSTQKIQEELKPLDLIMAFRFFLNAEKPLKKHVLCDMHKVLKNDGFLIFNIHENKYSLRLIPIVILNFLANLKRSIKGIKIDKKSYDYKTRRYMSYRFTKKLLNENGFCIIKRINYAYLPNYIYRFFPKKWMVKLELFMLYSKLPFATHNIYICKKK